MWISALVAMCGWKSLPTKWTGQLSMFRTSREDWDKFNFWDLKSEVDEPTIRAYSMANYPEEKGILKFNIRVLRRRRRMDHLPPGAMTSMWQT